MCPKHFHFTHVGGTHSYSTAMSTLPSSVSSHTELGNGLWAFIIMKHLAEAVLSNEAVALSMKRGVPIKLANLLIIAFDQNFRWSEGNLTHTGCCQQVSLQCYVRGPLFQNEQPPKT